MENEQTPEDWLPSLCNPSRSGVCHEPFKMIMGGQPRTLVADGVILLSLAGDYGYELLPADHPERSMDIIRSALDVTLNREASFEALREWCVGAEILRCTHCMGRGFFDCDRSSAETCRVCKDEDCDDGSFTCNTCQGSQYINHHYRPGFIGRTLINRAMLTRPLRLLSGINKSDRVFIETKTAHHPVKIRAECGDWTLAIHYMNPHCARPDHPSFGE